MSKESVEGLVLANLTNRKKKKDTNKRAVEIETREQKGCKILVAHINAPKLKTVKPLLPCYKNSR